MPLKLPSDFAAKIAETLNWKLAQVTDTFEIEEQKDGYFYARLKLKKWLEKPDFKTMCALVRDLGGEPYLEGMKCWRLAGPFAKKSPTDSQQKPSEHGIDSQPTYKEPGSAIPTSPKPEPAQPKKEPLSTDPYTMVPVQALLSMPFQSRIDIEGSDFADLVESVKTLGILQPIIVRQKPSGLFEIVAGERRVAAAKKVGLGEIPAHVKVLSDQEAYEIQLIENVQRKDLSDMEKARMLDMMIKQFSYTQEALAQKLGKQRLWVARHLAMLNLQTVSPGIQTRDLTERQAREILAAPEEKREEILDKINETGQVPSAREIHEIVHPEPDLRKEAGALLMLPCAYCGEPTSEPFSAPDKKLYCSQECYEQAKAESVPSATPTTPSTDTTFYQANKEPSGAPKGSPAERKPEPVDFAEVTCSECATTFRLVHYGPRDHRIVYYTTQEGEIS